MVTDFADAPCTTPANAPLFQSIIQHAGAEKVRQAKGVCRECPMALREACHSLGEWDGEVLPGIYGGKTPAERMSIWS